MKILKAICFVKTTHSEVLFKKTINDISISSTVFSINLRKTAYIEISINWPLTYFVEYFFCNVCSIIFVKNRNKT